MTEPAGRLVEIEVGPEAELALKLLKHLTASGKTEQQICDIVLMMLVLWIDNVVAEDRKLEVAEGLGQAIISNIIYKEELSKPTRAPLQ